MSRTAPAGRVAIVIPCYKQAHFLGDAIESALAQRHPASEIVVVDDGSPDDVAGVTARYPQVRYIRQRNQGLSGARNTGIRATSSEFLIFLDADDRLLPWAVERGLSHLQPHPERAFAAGRMHVIDGDGCLSYLWQPYEDVEDYFEQLFIDHCRIYPLTVMYRRSAIEAVGGGFNTALPSAEDWDMDIRLAHRFAFHLYNEPIAEYRRHGRNMSLDDVGMMVSIVRVLRAQRRPLQGRHPRYEAARRTGMRRVRERAGELVIDQVHASLREQDWRGALAGLWLLARWHPHFYVERVGMKTRRLLARLGGPMARSAHTELAELADSPPLVRREVKSP
jgi:glycosyltransferase involved in cell wall biosynthesis